MRHFDSRLSKLLLALAFFFATLLWTTAQTSAAVSNLRVVNVRNTSFTVTWLSDNTVPGQVRFVPSGQTYNESDYAVSQYFSGRGASFIGRTHYIAVTNLSASTTYQFDILSGNTVDDNNGQHYSVLTGPALAAGVNDILTGKMVNPDGSIATDAILYVRIKDTNGQGTIGYSQWLAAPMPSDPIAYSGVWQLNLREARTENLTALFTHSNSDQVEIQAYGVNSSWAGTVALTMPRDGQNFQIALNQYPPTPTPTGPTLTPSLTLTATAMLTPTATPTPTNTPSPSLTNTASATPSPVPSDTPTFTNTPSSTFTPTPTSTLTSTPTATDTPTATEVLTRVPVQSPGDNTNNTTSSRLNGPVLLLLIGIAGVLGGGLLIAVAVYLWRRQNSA